MPQYWIGNSKPVATEKLDESKVADPSNLRRIPVADEIGQTITYGVIDIRPAGDVQEIEHRDPSGALQMIYYTPGDNLIDQVGGTVSMLHSHHVDPGGVDWVESDDELVAQLMARAFSTPDHECVVGRPDKWGTAYGEPGHKTPAENPPIRGKGTTKKESA